MHVSTSTTPRVTDCYYQSYKWYLDGNRKAKGGVVGST